MRTTSTHGTPVFGGQPPPLPTTLRLSGKRSGRCCVLLYFLSDRGEEVRVALPQQNSGNTKKATRQNSKQQRLPNMAEDAIVDTEELREQDRFLPIANISRIMKKSLPDNAKIAKDAKETVQVSTNVFEFSPLPLSSATLAALTAESWPRQHWKHTQRLESAVKAALPLPSRGSTCLSLCFSGPKR